MKLQLKLAAVALALLTPLAARAQFFREVGMAPVHGVRHIAAGNRSNAHRQIEALEEQWRQAQLKQDGEALGKMMSDDYIGISATGMVQTRQQMIDRVTTRKLHVTRMDVDDQKVKIINGSTAVVTSQVDVEGDMDGHPLRGKYLYTRVYARQPNGTWKVVNFEATHIRRDLQTIANNR